MGRIGTGAAGPAAPGRDEAFLLPSDTKAQIDFRERVALAIVSQPLDRRGAAVENALNGYRLWLDLAFPACTNAQKWQATAAFEIALRNTLNDLSAALGENGEMARA
jgi:hypothetical protein